MSKPLQPLRFVPFEETELAKFASVIDKLVRNKAITACIKPDTRVIDMFMKMPQVLVNGKDTRAKQIEEFYRQVDEMTKHLDI